MPTPDEPQDEDRGDPLETRIEEDDTDDTIGRYVHAGKAGETGRIGHYRLIEKLGEGGMGAVYLAEQEEPIRREVALKVIKLGMDTGQVVARFEAERQALAMMDHPGIAHVYDAGATSEGRPFFVMERVRGEPITVHCDTARLSTEERLELFSQVCEAVQHAHQKGIIHRDLKPSNVLVTEEGAPKVIDFGIAKATAERSGESLLTVESQVLGTPEYMSPEQAGAAGFDVDTRSDVYSLGVLLYELLTGTLPFDLHTVVQNGLPALLQHIVEVDPQRPSTRVGTETDATRAIAAARGTRPNALARLLRGELDWIVLKAMEKDRERRYDSAAALAADVRRFLEHRPVEAGPPSALYRAAKFARRNRVGVAAAAAVLVALTGAVGALAWSLQRVSDERDEAREVTGFLTGMLKSASPREQGRDVEVRTLLRQAEGRLERELQDRPRVRARLAATLGAAYEALGDYERSQDLLARAAALRHEHLGADDRVTIATDMQLAVSMWRNASFEEARELLRDALDRSRDAFGPHDGTTFRIHGNLAMVTRSLGEEEEAVAMHDDLIALAREHLGEDHPDTLNLLQNQVVALWDERRFEDAEVILSDVFERMEQGSTSRDHPTFLLLLASHTRILEWRSKHDEAEALHNELLGTCRRVLGPEHPETLKSLQGLARFLANRARYDEAEPLLDEAIELQRDILGSDHPATLTALRQKGMLLWRTNRLAEAQELFQEVRHAYSTTLGVEHPRTVDVTNMLGIVHYGQGHHAEAEACWRAQLDAVVAEQGEEHKDTIIPRINLGMVCCDLGRFDEAERLYRKGLEQCLALYGPANDWTLNTQNNLAVLLMRQGKYEDAAQLNERVIEQRHETLGPKHPDTLGSQANLASCWNELGRLGEARELLQDVLERSIEVLGADHSSTLSSQQTLGTVLWNQGELDEAEQRFRDTAERLETAVGVEHPETLRARHMLAVVTRDRGDRDGARAMLEDLIEVQARALGADHADRLKSLEILARLRRGAGDAAGASELLATVRAARLERVAVVPASWTDLRAAAELLLETEDPLDAQRALELAQRLIGQQVSFDPSAHELLARCHAAVGDTERAREVVAAGLAQLADGAPGRAALADLAARLASE